MHLLAGARVPEPHRLVPVASRGQCAAVRGEGDRPKGSRMPTERPQFAAAGHVPELDAVVVTSRGQHAAVGGEDKTPNLSGMPELNKDIGLVDSPDDLRIVRRMFAPR